MNITEEILHWCQDMRYVLECPNRQTPEYIENKWRMQFEAQKRNSEIRELRKGLAND